ncbi:MAG: SufE family protein [Marinifilaceae bacterium]|nr:SufE family protein [Marinifilaceae bacterium]
MSKTIQEIEQEIIDEFSMFDDWMDKYEYIIELGKDMESFPPEMRTDENLIKGCQSQVWFIAEQRDNKLYFKADGDAIITKGLAALLIKVFNGQSATDIATADLTFIDEIGLSQHLSPTRSNGLLSMVKQIKMYALAYSAK